MTGREGRREVRWRDGGGEGKSVEAKSRVGEKKESFGWKNFENRNLTKRKGRKLN